MTRRVLLSNKLPELRSGNPEVDRWVEQYLQGFVTEVFEQIKFLTPETGMFDVTLFGASTAGTYEITTQGSSYYKIGDLVALFIDFTLAGAVTGGGVGAARIGGAPFEKIEGFNSAGAVYTSGVDLNGHSLVSNLLTSSETPNIGLSEIQDNAAATDLAVTSFAANDRLITTLTYVTNGVRSA